MAERSEVRFLVGPRDISLLQKKVHGDFGANQASSSWLQGALSHA
jgi:hypothetical protein